MYLVDLEATQRRFEQSPWVEAHLPAHIRTRSLSIFSHQNLVDRAMVYRLVEGAETDKRFLSNVLLKTPYRSIVLWFLGTDDLELRIVEALSTGRKAENPGRLRYPATVLLQPAIIRKPSSSTMPR